MDKQQAQRQIQDIFQKPFNRETYEYFLRNLLNEFEPRGIHYTGNLIPDAFKIHVTQYWRLGKYIDPDNIEMDLLVVEVKSLAKLDRARSALRNFAVNRLKQFDKECSLIAFYAREDGGQDWRFSFIKIEHEAYKDEKGKVKLKTELTPAKRSSFLVGVHENSHTATKQLLPLMAMDYANPRIVDIEKAFSIETVTKEFFDQYKGLYLKLAEQLQKQPFFQHKTDEENAQAVTRFAKKLLGQIVFLYFLQKKGWLGVARNEKWGNGSKRFLRERFSNCADAGSNYYHDFLQFLFYEALAQERKNQSDPDYYTRFDCKIPFLNGGLFEAEYDWQQESIDLPNHFFHNGEKNQAGDTGTGILDVFDRYNFTIKEDEPLEKEVAVDPEMLGKVFENMLEVVERKSKGAFYTPREIVHYMCQESLIHYLDNSLNTYIQRQPRNLLTFAERDKPFVPRDLLDMVEQDVILVPKTDLEILIRRGHLALENDQRVLNKGRETDTYKFKLPETVRKNALLIDEKLAAIKVCDPAIGSGAFPVGLLHEIVNARLALGPHAGNNNSAYKLKRHAIRESLYGVDIDASAIDIARLRLWLSLIVDEDDYNTIEALPNLDYKIVKGDSLLGLNLQLIDRHLFDDIERKKGVFIGCTNQEKKKKLHLEIDDLIVQVSRDKRYFDFKLYFSEIWHDRDGFDVVIGNPPYVQIQKFSGQPIQKAWEGQQYETFAKTGDIYCLFYEKGHRILREGGTLSFITSNKWMRANYGQKLRKFLLKKTTIKGLIDFGDSPIFSEATTYTNILRFTKTTHQGTQHAWDLTRAYQSEVSLDRMLADTPKGEAIFEEDSFVILPAKLAAIKKHIEAVGTPLKDWDISINYGIKTGFNEAFIIDGKKKNDLIAQDPKNVEIIKPILRGRDIKRYRVDFADLWLIATFPALKLDIDDYPTIRDYLRSFGKKLHQTGAVIGRDENGKVIKSRKKTGNKWFETQDQIAYFKGFEKEKIVWPETSLDNQFYLDRNNFFLDKTCFFMVPSNKYLLAIFNSAIARCYFSLLVSKMRGGYFSMSKIYVEHVPIIELPSSQRLPFEIIVNYVQLVNTQNKKLQSTFFEQLIDGLAYELYFPDEIKSADKEILPHLCELQPLTDEMTDEEKLAVIQQEFDRLYDPHHPVRNHLETLDNVEVVHTIRESLKR